MSCIGLDVGNQSSTLAIARRGGIDILINEVSNRTTPSIVGFTDKERMIGEKGNVGWGRNVKNTINYMKRFIGRRFSDPDIQDEIKLVPFKVVEVDHGMCGVEARYENEQRIFTMVQIMSMLLQQMRIIAEQSSNTKVADIVISVPVYFTDLQRRAMLEAAHVAGLNCLKLVNETAATAISYGIYKTDLEETEPKRVVFVDIGKCSMTAAVVDFVKGKMAVKGVGYDRNLGGRDFDEVLATHFAAEFKEKYKIDVLTNARALLRLRAGCEKVKKTLSSLPADLDTPLNLESLLEDKDVTGRLSRAKLEELSTSLLERIDAPIQQALTHAGYTVDQIDAVEIVGGVHRMPAVKARISAFFGGKELSHTLNSDECVAKGCALQCAILSPVFKVRDYSITECVTFPITVFHSTDGPIDSSVAPTEDNSSELFPASSTFPSLKAMTFPRQPRFDFSARYSAGSNLPPSAKPTDAFHIGSWNFNNISMADSVDPAKVKVRMRLDVNGIFTVEKAEVVETYMEEVKEKVVAPAKPAEEKKEEKAADAEKKEDDDAEKKEETEEMEVDGDKKEDGEKTDDKKAEEKTEEKTEEKQEEEEVFITKEVKKVRRTDLAAVALVPGVLSTQEKALLLEKEGQMMATDKLLIATADAKNALESYVYDIRGKIGDKLHDYVDEATRDSFRAQLNKMEDWLYEEGEEETKSVYVTKLEELVKIGGPIETRYKEEQDRPDAIQSLRNTIVAWKTLAKIEDEKYAHIDAADREKVVKQCADAALWLEGKIKEQEALPKHADPVLVKADLVNRVALVANFCKAIMNKSKPAPPKEEPKKEEEAKKEEAKKEEAKKDGDAAESMEVDADAEAPKAETPAVDAAEEKMDTTG
eukprot:TRINITY_DN35_c0_g2_i1.p1 TRINITY_DN35_c0_g2~~TRINITY_DN35_c0_g2_i1.p1  ORF type:complete len:873 (-),score=354.80 TRINITY_DN35_c0_g2_i1:275-2893(-)